MAHLSGFALAQRARTFEPKSIEPELTLIPDLAFVNGLFALILVANVNGVLIGELDAQIESVTWKLNEYGLAKLLLANPGTAAELLQLGNRIFIYFDNGLQPWVGVVDPPRRWRYGRVILTAYGGEKLMSWRVTGSARYFTKSTPGGIYTANINEMAGPQVLEAGRIYTGGGAYTREYHYRDLLDIAQDDLIALEGMDFDVTGTIENGRLRLFANFYERKGRDLPNCWLLEGHNIGTIEPEEQGEIINELFTAGAGTGWNGNRLYSTARNDDSVNRFGLRQAGDVLSSINDQDALDALTAQSVEESAFPYVALPFNALNLPPAAFGDYGIGDGVNVELYSYLEGFQDMRRVVGRDYRPRDGACRTVVI